MHLRIFFSPFVSDQKNKIEVNLFLLQLSMHRSLNHLFLQFLSCAVLATVHLRASFVTLYFLLKCGKDQTKALAYGIHTNFQHAQTVAVTFKLNKQLKL